MAESLFLRARKPRPAAPHPNHKAWASGSGRGRKQVSAGSPGRAGMLLALNKALLYVNCQPGFRKGSPGG